PIPVDPTPVDPTPIYNAGNTLATARDLGTLRVNASEIGYSLGVRDFVNNVDEYDYYRFNFEDTNNLNVRLDDLSGDAKVELIQDLNNNNQVDEGEVLEISDGGTASQLINRTPLDKGIYYVRVSPGDAGETNYCLSLTASSPELSIAPNQPLIGIIDTGFSGNNADLDYRRFKLGSDRISNDNNPLLSPGEGNEHGTHILGLIAATQGNGIGIDGINEKAPIWLGRAVGSGNWASSLIEFVDAAKQSGQKNAVVNLSLDLTQINPDGSVTTRYELTPKEREAIEFARQNHVLIVTAAGNDGGVMSVLGQASQEFDNIITVGASNEFDRANYSSYGAGLDILTEGGNTDNPVLSTVKDGVGMMAGTSVAAARATGVASLIWAANPNLSYRQVIDILELTAVDVKTPGWDAETGAGLLNAVSAIELAKKTTPQTYTPFPWVAPLTWSGEGLVTPVDRAASGGNTLATAAVQPDPNFSDSDTVDVNNREKYYEVTIEQPGYLRYTITRSNGTEWLPNVERLRTDGKPTSRQFSSSYSKLYNVGAGSPNGGGYVGGAYIAPVSNTEEMFVDPGTYYFKIDLEDSQNNFLDTFGDEPIVYHTNLQNYNLTSEFIPDRPSSFSGAAQFKTPSGVTVAELNTSDQLNYNPTNSTQPGVNYWLDVNEPGNLSLKISSSIADRIQLQVKKLVGLEGENGAGEILVDTGFVALDLSQPIELKNLNKGRYILEVLPRPSWDNINRQWIQQPYTQPFTINGVFSRQAPNPGEGQVPSYAGGFSKTITSNGVDTHYYANGYLSVQPSGYATWYTYGAGVPLPTIPGATVPGASVPPFSTLGLGTATPVATVPPDYAGNSFNQARNIGVLNSTQTFQDFLGDADPSDYYRFELNNDSNLNWRVDGLNPGVDFQLYNNDFKLQWSTNTPAPNFSSDMAGTYPGTPGTYYIRLKPFASGGSNYNFSLSAIPRNTAPENLQFNLTSNSYSVGETVDLNGKVFDRNGANDISRVDLSLKQNGNEWQFLRSNQSLNRDGQWANFSLSLDDLATGNYELQAIAYDQSGAASNTVTGAFQVTAPFDNNATQWFSNGKTLSGDMLAEYNRLVSQGNYLGNPSFVDSTDRNTYFGTPVRRSFFQQPGQTRGYYSIYQSKYGTFSLGGAIADYYTNTYFNSPNDLNGLFAVDSGLGVPTSSVIRQADGTEVAYFEGGMLTNRYGVVTPTYYQKDRFDLVGQGAPNGTELQWKNDYGYWNPSSVGQPTDSVRRINNGWIQEFKTNPSGDIDNIFLLKDGQSVLGGKDTNNIPNGGPYRVQGGFLNAYRSVGGYERQNGGLGFPTMSQLRSDFNGYELYQAFENGFIAKTYDDHTIIRNWQGQDIQPEISANHWKAEYFNNRDLSGNSVLLEDWGESNSFRREWGDGAPAGVPSDNFSVRLTTQRYFAPGNYQINTNSDDGVRVRIGNQTAIDKWVEQEFKNQHEGYFRSEGGEYPVTVEYFESGGNAALQLNIYFAETVGGSQWRSTFYRWDQNQGNMPPGNFYENSNNIIGVLNLGENRRSDGKYGINQNWGAGSPKGDSRIPNDYFAVRSYTQAKFEAGKTYVARVRADDGFQLSAKRANTEEWVDITPKDQWQQAYGAYKEIQFQVPQSGWYDFHFHHFEERGDAYIDLSWEEVTGGSPNGGGNPGSYPGNGGNSNYLSELNSWSNDQWNWAAGDNTRITGKYWSVETDETNYSSQQAILQIYNELSKQLLGAEYKSSAGYVQDPSYYNDPAAGGQYGYHDGIDIDTPNWTPTNVKALVGGTVSIVQNQVGNYFLQVAGDDGRFYRYGHLSSVNISSGRVNAGDVIGQVGMSSASNHLHFQVNRSKSQPTGYNRWNQADVYGWTLNPLKVFWELRNNGINNTGSGSSSGGSSGSNLGSFPGNNGNNSDIDIQLDFYGEFSQIQKEVIEQAAKNWENIITQDKVVTGVLRIAVTQSTKKISGQNWNAWAESYLDYEKNNRIDWTASNGNDFEGQNRINFNSNRLNEPLSNNWLLRLTMHELGHTLGLDEANPGYDTSLGMDSLMN
ncbi:S8 family serine peptidase, partial [Planktothrix sp. FACHB-1355]